MNKNTALYFIYIGINKNTGISKNIYLDFVCK